MRSSGVYLLVDVVEARLWGSWKGSVEGCKEDGAESISIAFGSVVLILFVDSGVV